MAGIIDTPSFSKGFICIGNYNMKGYVGRKFIHEEKNGNYISKHFSINQNIVFLESHNGKEFIGNPYYIAKCLLETSKYENIF